MRDNNTFQDAARSAEGHYWESHPRREFMEASFVGDSPSDGRSAALRRSGPEFDNEDPLPVFGVKSVMSGFSPDEVARRRIAVQATLLSLTCPVDELPLSRAFL